MARESSTDPPPQTQGPGVQFPARRAALRVVLPVLLLLAVLLAQIWLVFVPLPSPVAQLTAGRVLGGLVITGILVSLVLAQLGQRRALAQLRAFVDAVPDPAFVIDANGRVLDIMGGSEAMQNRPEAIPVGALVSDVIPADRAQRVLDNVAATLQQGALTTLEYGFEVAGEQRWYEARVAPIGPKARAVVWVPRDITARRDAEIQLRTYNETLEQLVAVRTAELAEALAELRAFNYTVSHDLRAPLRSIEGFTAIALESAGPTLNEEAQAALGRVRRATGQMTRMIDGLLALSSIGIQELRRAPIDLSAMARDVAAEETLAHAGVQTEIAIEPGMRVNGDYELVRALLRNLIGNAFKYSRGRPDARIEIGRDAALAGMPFYVRDNGAGFDMRYVDRLFRPFSRLHSTTEFPGTGIGLASARRIVQRHGGTLAATAAVGQGATFHFTLGQ